jgi:pre-mRNA-splicing factor CDC5/CEF1
VALTSSQDVQEELVSSAEKGAKLEKKLAKFQGGYKARAEMLRKKIGEAHDALEKAQNALGGFNVLASSEQAAIKKRLESLREEVGFVSTREREAQEAYRRTRDELSGLMAAAGGETNGYH